MGERGAAPAAGRSKLAAATSEERTWAMLSHLLPLLGLSFVAPLVIWLVKKDESRFVADQAKEALNWQISLFLYFAASLLLTLVLIGFALLLLLGIASLVLGIVAAIRAHEGKRYRYPFCVRLLG